MAFVLGLINGKIRITLRIFVFMIWNTHATILLALGVDIKTISERLGHSDIQTTLNIYADVVKELDLRSSEKIDNL